MRPRPTTAAGPSLGALLRDYPRTLTFRNWPFLVFLGVIAVTPIGLSASTATLTGKPLASMSVADFSVELIIAASVLGTALLIGAFQVVTESLGVWMLAAVHEQGLMVRHFRATQPFAWSAITAITERTTSTVVHDKLLRVTFYELSVTGLAKPVVINPLTHPGAIELVCERAPVPVTSAA